MKAECEKQRTERIPLLDAGLRGDVAASELEVGRLVVAPLCPARECWHFVPTLFQKLLPVQSVKGVGKIDFDKNCIWPVGIAFAPLAGCVKTNLCPQRLSDADLKGEQIVSCHALVVCTEAFGSESAKCFANRDGANPTILLRQSCETCTGKERCDLNRRVAFGEQVDQGSQVFQNRRFVTRAQRFLKVEWPQSRRAAARQFVKRPNGLFDVVTVEGRDQSAVGCAES